jgi:hypothetical protein
VGTPGFDAAICLKAIRAHFDQQGKPVALIEFSTPLAHAHREVGKTFMARHEALALVTGRNATLSQVSPGPSAR